MSEINLSASMSGSAAPQQPAIRALSRADLRAALSAGWRDFAAAPQYGLFFGLLYAAGGWTVVMLAVVAGYYYLAYPLAAGFALIAPFVAAGIYEVSRRFEAGLPVTWRDVFCAICNGSKRDLGWMTLVTTFTFFIWIDIAIFLYAMFFGLTAPTPWGLITAILTTPQGLIFFAVGNLIGACIAFFVFSISVVSFPMLLDRDVDFVTAMITSVRAVKANRKEMIIWAVVIALLLAVSLATALVAMVIVLPWLGHATWHMYRRAVVPAS